MDENTPKDQAEDLAPAWSPVLWPKWDTSAAEPDQAFLFEVVPSDTLGFSAYQALASQNITYPRDNPALELAYICLGLVGESGEVAERAKKVIRDNNGVLDDKVATAIAYELGDVLWYIARVADYVGVGLLQVAEMNLKKLADRKARGTLNGDGDNR